MRLNENKKKGCEKIVDDDKTQLAPKLYPPLKNVVDDIIFIICENVLEYHAKLETCTKLRCSWVLISKQVLLVQQKRKKRRAFLWTFLMATYLKLQSTMSLIRNRLQNLQASKL